MNFNMIWFNPDLSKYQVGLLEEFKKIRNSSINYGRFELVGSVPAESPALAARVAHHLNLTRS